jgi:hypothetical protein
MALGIKELQKIKGVGDVLSRRFLEAGYDSFAKIAAAGEEGLRKIPGVNPRLLGSIVAQAGALSGGAEKNLAEQAEVLKKRAASLREQLQGLALSVRDRFREKAAGKSGRKVAQEIMKVICCLENVEVALKPRLKKTGRALARVERRLEGLGESGIRKIGRRLKKARKRLEAASR